MSPYLIFFTSLLIHFYGSVSGLKSTGYSPQSRLSRMYSKLNAANNQDSDLYDYNRSPKRARSVTRNSRSIDLDGEQYDIIEAQQLISDDNKDNDNEISDSDSGDSGNNNHDHGHEEEEHKYKFGYQVHDADSKMNFGHEEHRENKMTKGRYHVLLPDGRVQSVEYWADKTGFHSKVTYYEMEHDH